jgi:hypothetical protein
MRHLSADELVDLVEGIVSDAPGDSIAHLASCDRCRDQLAGLRAARAMASEIEVPEPSPLFWDHFSARVREAVANEPPPPDGWWHRLWSWPGVVAPVSAAAAVIVVIAVMLRAPTPTTSPVAAARPAGNVGNVAGPTPGYSLELLGDNIADDLSLSLVADLTDEMGLDAAADAGLTSDNSAEHAVTHMSAAELEQLERLLTEEMSRKGA